MVFISAAFLMSVEFRGCGDGRGEGLDCRLEVTAQDDFVAGGPSGVHWGPWLEAHCCLNRWATADACAPCTIAFLPLSTCPILGDSVTHWITRISHV